MFNSKKNKNKTQGSQRGSFLLELLLAFVVISITMTVVVDAFVTSQRSYRAIAEEGALTKSLTVVLENMTREARVSGRYRCLAVGTAPCTGAAFHMTNIAGLNGQIGNDVAYTLNAGAIEKNSLRMTPPTVNVTDFSVKIVGSPSTQVQALITLTAHAVTNPDVKVYVQTSFTERSY